MQRSNIEANTAIGEQSGSSSSRYSEEEILTELRDMGYQISPDQIADLKRAVDQFLAEEDARGGKEDDYFGAGSTVEQKFAAGPSHEPQFLDQYHVLGRAQNIHQRFTNESTRLDAGLESNPWMQSLLKEARECSDRTRNESTQLKTMLDEHVRGRHEDGMENDMTDGNGKAESAAVMENQKGVRFDDVQPTCSSDRRALKELDQALRAQGVVEGSALLPTKELDNYFKEAQRWEKRDKLNEPCIRPVVCPEPGLAPFKHDPVKRYERYKKEWERCPAPGEKKRLDLRWKVREYMLRQDIPLATLNSRPPFK